MSGPSPSARPTRQYAAALAGGSPVAGTLSARATASYRRYEAATIGAVAVTKVSVSLDDEAIASARAAAEAEGISLSAWLSRAALHAAAGSLSRRRGWLGGPDRVHANVRAARTE
jgi:hypothetical protein